MSRNRASAQADTSEHELLNHIQKLGLASVEDYQEWCLQNGISQKLKKSCAQRSREYYFLKETIATQRLKRKKRESRNQADVIKAICRGDLNEDQITAPHLLRLCTLLQASQKSKIEGPVDRQALVRLLDHLFACRAKFFDGSPAIASLDHLPGNTYLEALARISVYSTSWIRPVEKWRPKSHSAMRQFASLLRHLLVRYDDVPLFFDSVWLSGPDQPWPDRRGWYLHVGHGQNIRKCDLPIPMTKKMAHYFMHAPNNLTVDQALRWGQILGLGGDEHLARAIFETRLAESFEHEEFWTTVLRWFITHPMLDRAHVGPVIDYLHYQRFVPAPVVAADRTAGPRLAPQPNLTMSGRTPQALLARVASWHRMLANENRHQISQWRSTGIKGLEFIEGSEKNNSAKYWAIRELLSSTALAVEGRRMKHCVASYAGSCARGHCSIWTMEVDSSGGCEKVLTLEVSNANRQIRQARGKLNRLPTEKERSILLRWAETAGLRLASYI